MLINKLFIDYRQKICFSQNGEWVIFGLQYLDQISSIDGVRDMKPHHSLLYHYLYLYVSLLDYLTKR